MRARPAAAYAARFKHQPAFRIKRHVPGVENGRSRPAFLFLADNQPAVSGEFQAALIGLRQRGGVGRITKPLTKNNYGQG
ncbi:MAG TPA: hypothetical protein DCG47_00150 [Spirochaetaceae bacterium]|nr:hypothetical protein [Spirochaetaceae bacterium]